MPKVKYVTSKSYYYGCPAHEGTGSAKIVFLNSLREYMDMLISEMNEYEYGDEIYSTRTGRVIGYLSTNMGGHSVTDLRLTLKPRIGVVHVYETKDNGHGRRVWVKKD